MFMVRRLWSLGVMCVVFLLVPASAQAEDAQLSAGVKVVWDMSKAWHETTPTRERICINGLWRWQPVDATANKVPTDNWGFFKVPGPWPPNHDPERPRETQAVYASPAWKDVKLGDVNFAWYQREIQIPKDWTGRRVVLYAEYVNSRADVFIDGKSVGVILFPYGEVDLTASCEPGSKHLLSLYVTALPLGSVLLAYNDTDAPPREIRSIGNRGLCGDVYLIGSPAGPRIADLKIAPSGRKWNISFSTALDALKPGQSYRLRAVVTDAGKPVQEFTSLPFTDADLVEGRFSFTSDWKPGKLWDLHTPQNTYNVQMSLLDAASKPLDVFHPERFGFREFWIERRDFYLNGSRVFLSAVPLSNAHSPATATYEATCETFRRLRTFGINFVFGGNYSCNPGSHLSFAESLRAADDMGFLVALTQPHFGGYNWDTPDADKTNGYARQAEFYVRVAQNHPSVVFYATSHNSTGYEGSTKPENIGNAYSNRSRGGQGNADRALRAEAIIKHFDPSRIVYHHSSGNLSAMFTANFYPNWTPMQELADWFEPWATRGDRPVFLCEYGPAYTWDWTMYRGWYNGRRAWGSAKVPWEFCMAEWNAQFLGDVAYRISDAEKENLRWEAKKFNAGETWGRYDCPHNLDLTDFDEWLPIVHMYLTDNWSAFRTWGVSAVSPEEHMLYWKRRKDVDASSKPFKVDWDNLQRPGLSPDFTGRPGGRVELGYEYSDWLRTPAAEALYRNNMPLLAYIAGKPDAFTSKDHNVLPGQSFRKQVIVINSSRVPVTADCSWTLVLPRPQSGSKQVPVPVGDQVRIPLQFSLPANLTPGSYDLNMTVKFSTGETQTDTFAIDVLAPIPPINVAVKTALFDPKGETAALLKELGLQYQSVNADADLAGFDLLIVGKAALTLDGAAPDISRVREGLRVVLFEQTSDVLEQRLGFRVQEYGLRNVFSRVPDSPLLEGLSSVNLLNWTGASTLYPPQLTYDHYDREYGNVVMWAGIPVTRIYRCGNRGNVASVLIEKPTCGNFLPVIDGGFSLQYAPLMEFREGAGMILFCQMDVTGRTESDPAARRLVRNILQYVSEWKPAPARTVVYAGDAAGKTFLKSTGLALTDYQGGLKADQVLVVGPGGADALAADATFAAWLKAGGHVLTIGLDEKQAQTMGVQTTRAEHIAAWFPPFDSSSLLAGVCPANVHSREPRQMVLVASGAKVIGDGVLAQGENRNVVFCQLAPWTYKASQQNTKKTFKNSATMISRLLGNMGVSAATPLLERFHSPVDKAKPEQRWLTGFYLDTPEQWDDPYRYFCW